MTDVKPSHFKEVTLADIDETMRRLHELEGSVFQTQARGPSSLSMARWPQHVEFRHAHVFYAARQRAKRQGF